MSALFLLFKKNHMSKFTIAIHGGAGTILKSMLTPELEIRYNQGLQEALDAGYDVLKEQGTSLNAIVEAIKKLENNELFNAGRGAVFTNKGIHEMDACIMTGHDLDAGAVAGISNIKNPIELAKYVMLESGHVLLSGQGAKEFATSK
jgi:beta-aspartyl-peptidase (threonine type)